MSRRPPTGWMSSIPRTIRLTARAVERSRKGADSELDSALRRPDQPGRTFRAARATAALIISSRRRRRCAGEPHADSGAMFSRTHGCIRTVEAMSIALMVDPKGDPEIIAAQDIPKMKVTLDDWIPKILAAQEPDGYLQTAWTLRNTNRWTEGAGRRSSRAAITRATPPVISSEVGHQPLHAHGRQGQAPLQRR